MCVLSMRVVCSVVCVEYLKGVLVMGKSIWFVVAGSMLLILGYGAIHDYQRITADTERVRMHGVEMRILDGIEIRVKKCSADLDRINIEIKEMLDSSK